MGAIWVAVEDSREVVGAQRLELFAMLGFCGVEGLADQREGLFVNWVFFEEVEDYEYDFIGKNMEDVVVVVGVVG